MKKNNSVTLLTQAAMIAALYVVLTLMAAAFGLDHYAIQLRFSEALTILPFLRLPPFPAFLQAVCWPIY